MSRLAAEQALFEALQDRRAEIARREGVSPYVVFHDKTLAEMAYERPAGFDDLLCIHGIGTRKAEKYGDDFLAVIASFEHRGACG